MILLNFRQPHIKDIICYMLLFLYFHCTRRINLPPYGARQVLPEKCQRRAVISAGFQHQGRPQNINQNPAMHLAEIWQKVLESKIFQQSTSNFTSDFTGAHHTVITRVIS